jgi:hypothetical protein
MALLCHARAALSSPRPGLLRSYKAAQGDRRICAEGQLLEAAEMRATQGPLSTLSCHSRIARGARPVCPLLGKSVGMSSRRRDGGFLAHVGVGDMCVALARKTNRQRLDQRRRLSIGGLAPSTQQAGSLAPTRQRSRERATTIRRQVGVNTTRSGPETRSRHSPTYRSAYYRHRRGQTADFQTWTATRAVGQPYAE